MDEITYLLVCLAEECAEVAQRATKAIRFGIYEVQPSPANPEALNNRERLRQELVDLQGIVAMLMALEALPADTLRPSCYELEAKITKVMEMMAYSRHVGQLRPEVPNTHANRTV